jgi:hypothetical protein
MYPSRRDTNLIELKGHTHKKPEERYTEFGVLNSLRYAWILNVKVELELFDVPPFLVFWS